MVVLEMIVKIPVSSLFPDADRQKSSSIETANLNYC
jgi:hypothetical protein